MPRPIDLRPWVVLPGMVDLHAHLPQLPNAGLGAGMDLLAWLERYIFPLERGFDVATAEIVAPAAWRAFAAAGTTTAMVYGAVYEASLDATFRAAEAHGIRAIVGKVMMDRITYDPTIDPAAILDRSLAESARLIERWHGAADGRLGYAVTPRFAISCTAELLRESASLAARDRRLVADAPVRGPRRDRGSRRGCSPTRSTTSMSTTGPAGSGRAPCSPTPVHLSGSRARPPGRGRARGSRTVRSRTCSLPPG